MQTDYADNYRNLYWIACACSVGHCFGPLVTKAITELRQLVWRMHENERALDYVRVECVGMCGECTRVDLIA